MNRLGALFSVCDVNNNHSKGGSNRMGVKGKKCKFGGDLDIFGKETERKNYIWSNVKMSSNSKKSKGKFVLL